MTADALAVIRRRCAGLHGRVEALVDIESRLRDPATLAPVIEALDGFWRATEPAAEAWARAHPETADSLHWPRRRHDGRGAADLATLGFAATAVAAPVTAAGFTTAEMFGWLYVAEGSTLGGAVIQRLVASQGGRPAGLRLHTFAPYDEGPQPMWRSYLAHLEAWVDTDELRCSAVATAAEATFSSLAQWLLPLSRPAAA